MADGWGVVRIAKENRDGKCLMLSGTKYLTECFSLKTTEHVKKHHNLFFFGSWFSAPRLPGESLFLERLLLQTQCMLWNTQGLRDFFLSVICVTEIPRNSTQCWSPPVGMSSRQRTAEPLVLVADVWVPPVPKLSGWLSSGGMLGLSRAAGSVLHARELQAKPSSTALLANRADLRACCITFGSILKQAAAWLLFHKHLILN